MTDFQWPWEYTFPPFFTLQPHEETRHQQLNVWAQLLLNYHKHHNKFTVSVSDKTLPLFWNETLNRRLEEATILLVLEQLQRSGHAAPLDKRRVEWQVYWHTLEEYANMVYEWVQETAQLNTVCTLYEVASGDNVGDAAFRDIDETVLLQALRLLEERDKCELIHMDGSYGVKFF